MSAYIGSDIVIGTTEYGWNGTADGSTSYQAEDGITVRTNEVPNPTFRTNLSGWTITSSATATRYPDGLLLSTTAAIPAEGTLANYRLLPAAPGDVKSFSMDVQNLSSGPITIAGMISTVGGTSISRSSAPVTLQSLEATTLKVENVTMPEGTTSYGVFVKPTSVTMPISSAVYIQRVLAENGSTVGDYFDGASFGWTEYAVSHPLLIDGWEESAESRNVVNNVIGGGIDITSYPADLRNGQFVAVYQDEYEAAALFQMHTQAARFYVGDDERPTIEMSYVPNGTITRALDDDSREFWLVTIPFQEVGA